MNSQKEQEESLREAASIGDLLTIQALISQGVDVNSGNPMNGWTALHWATQRDHANIVAALLQAGANTTIENTKKQTAAALCKSQEVATLLECDVKKTTSNGSESSLPITPNYIEHPPFPHVKRADIPENTSDRESAFSLLNTIPEQEIVLKARVANSYETDFIEVELPHSKRTYSYLVTLLCDELGVKPELLQKVRKLPNTIVRKDKDVARLKELQEIELVLTNKATSEQSRVYETPRPQPGHIFY